MVTGSCVKYSGLKWYGQTLFCENFGKFYIIKPYLSLTPFIQKLINYTVSLRFSWTFTTQAVNKYSLRLQTNGHFDEAEQKPTTLRHACEQDYATFQKGAVHKEGDWGSPV